MQIDPINPTLKAPGCKRFNSNTLLSSIPFKFNLRPYILAEYTEALKEYKASGGGKQVVVDDDDSGEEAGGDDAGEESD